MIGEFFMGLISGVSEILKPVVIGLESIIGVVAKCGSYVAGKVSEFISEIDINCNGLCTTLDDASDFLNGVGDYLLGIGKDLNIPEIENCSNEDIGAKVLLPETREREKDETAAGYINYLNTVEFNKTEFENWTAEDKVASEAIGNALISEIIKEKTGIDISVKFATNMEKAEVKHEEVTKLIEEFNKIGLTDTAEMNDFLTNSPNLTIEKSEKMESLASKALQELNPQMSKEDAIERIKTMKIAIQSSLD